jgi:endonuclease YncB( thermonuclease family)
MKRISSEILKSFFRKRFFSVVVVLSLVVSKSGAEADSKGGQKNLPAAELSERGERSLNCQHTATQFSCVKFVRNYDGDTFTVNIPGVPELIGRNISVRVRGIDTPEIKGRGACEKEAARMAKKFLSSQLRAASKVHLKGIERVSIFVSSLMSRWMVKTWP